MIIIYHVYNKSQKYLKVWKSQETFVELLLALTKCTETFRLNWQPSSHPICSNQKILVMLCYLNLCRHEVTTEHILQ